MNADAYRPLRGVFRADALIIAASGPAILLAGVVVAWLAGGSPLGWLTLDWRLALPWTALGGALVALAAGGHVHTYADRFPEGDDG